MCGIVGIIDYSRKSDLASAIDGMVSQVAHRGPDGQGILLRDHIALGHSRLSIIDLDGGAQPMSTADNRIHVTFNGEIYNYRELRRQLGSGDHSFRTDSDTEVVLAAYRRWGKRCVEHFEGMFAVAIADFDKNEMFLARDPFGIKPLLYRIAVDSFSFASEQQAFWALPDWRSEIDLNAIDQYLRYQYIPAPRTAFRGVFKLPAAHRMTVRMGEPHQKIERYWEPDFSRKSRAKEAGLVDQLDEALKDSVRKHLVSDVPFGALLSGGIDSSLVVGYMSELLDAPVKTFSIGFEDASVNELDYARHVAKVYRTQHHEEIVRFDALQILPELVKHYGEPFGDQSAIPTWHVCQLARSHVPMVLSGDGGDEMLAGYGTYGNWLRRMDYHCGPKPSGCRTRLRKILQTLTPWRYRQEAAPECNSIHWIDCVIRFSHAQREQIWRPEYRFVCDQASEEFDRALAVGEGLAGVNRVQRADMETFLPEDILTKVDVASMRFGLEVRPPILDRQFFAAASQIPSHQLFTRDAKGNNFSGKIPLKQLAERKLGREFAFRPKQGFVLPLQSWFERGSDGALEVRDRLTDRDSKIGKWFDRSKIESLFDSEHFVNVWQLLVLEEWLCQAHDAPSVAVA